MGGIFLINPMIVLSQAFKIKKLINHKGLARFSHSLQKMTTQKLDLIESVDIDASGRFKYILIKVHDSNQEGKEVSKFIVRGYDSCEYHADIYDRVTPEIEGKGLDCECVGGGRILHSPQEKSLEVYGYSM